MYAKKFKLHEIIDL